MRSYHVFILLLLPALFAACSSSVSPGEETAAQKAAALFGAESCRIEHITTADQHPAVRLKLSNLARVKPNASPDKITSTVALTFFESLAAEDYSDDERVLVSASGTHVIGEQAYAIADLKITAEQIPVCGKFFEALRHDPQTAKALVASANVPDTALTSISNAVREADSPALKTVFTGFRYDTFNKQRIAVIWMQARNGSQVNHYTFYVSMQTKKIMYAGMNDAASQGA